MAFKNAYEALSRLSVILRKWVARAKGNIFHKLLYYNHISIERVIKMPNFHFHTFIYEMSKSVFYVRCFSGLFEVIYGTDVTIRQYFPTFICHLAAMSLTYG